MEPVVEDVVVRLHLGIIQLQYEHVNAVLVDLPLLVQIAVAGVELILQNDLRGTSEGLLVSVVLHAIFRNYFAREWQAFLSTN